MYWVDRACPQDVVMDLGTSSIPCGLQTLSLRPNETISSSDGEKLYIPCPTSNLNTLLPLVHLT